MVLEGVVLWQKIVLYVFILIGLFIYVKLSMLKVDGRYLVPLHYRVLIALFFPLLFVLVFVFGAVLLALVLVVVLILFLLGLIGRKRIKIKRIRI